MSNGHRHNQAELVMKTYKYDLLKMRHARLVAECAKDAQAIEAEIESAFSSANAEVSDSRREKP